MDGHPLGTALLEFKADHDLDAARQITLYLFDLWQDAPQAGPPCGRAPTR